MNGSLILIPTYNERENMAELLPRIQSLEGIDVLFIDDDSPDGTALLIKKVSAEDPRFSLIIHGLKGGLGRAYTSGFERAVRLGYQRIVTMDADLSHAPEDIPRLLQALDKADIAIGSRHCTGGAVFHWPLHRKIISQVGSLCARALLRLPVRDATSGFRAYRLESIQHIDWSTFTSKGFIFQVELLDRILATPGRKAVEVPILFRNRTRGTSKLSLWIILEAASKLTGLSLQHWRRTRV